MELRNGEITVGRIVAERPEASRLFERLGIDYCCGGGKPLVEACRERDLDPEDVIARLDTLLAVRPDACMQAWLERPASELIDHIVARHHDLLRREVPRLQRLAVKVARVHGERHESLVRLWFLVERFADEIADHMAKEENILFPLIRQREEAGDAWRGSLGAAIRQMELDHDGAGEILGAMRSVTSDFQPPQEACHTWRALYEGLAHLERDMHRHVHEENNILFPRALGRI